MQPPAAPRQLQTSFIARFVQCCLLLVLPVSASSSENKVASALLEAFKAEAEEVAHAPHKEASGKLRENYLTAIKRELETATKDGNLDAALQIRKVIEALEQGEDLPPAAATPPVGLKRLREILENEQSLLDAKRDGALEGVIEKYSAELEKMEIALTKKGDLDGAIAVRNIRLGLGKDEVVSPPEPPAPKPATISPAPPTSPHHAHPPLKGLNIHPEVPQPDADGWITLFDGTNLYGINKTHEQLEQQGIRLVNRALELRNTALSFDLEASDLILRSELKKGGGQNLTLKWRENKDRGERYALWFNGDTRFGVGRHISNTWRDIEKMESRAPRTDFFELTGIMEGDTITVLVDGEKIGGFRNSEIQHKGNVGIAAFRGWSHFRKVQVKVLTQGQEDITQSLVGSSWTWGEKSLKLHFREGGVAKGWGKNDFSWKATGPSSVRLFFSQKIDGPYWADLEFDSSFQTYSGINKKGEKISGKRITTPANR